MEDFDGHTKPSSFTKKNFELKDFKLTEKDLYLKCRSNSLKIPLITELAYCLDFVPKLK